MKSILLFACFAILCTAFAKNCEPKCKPNTTWKVDDCNTCTCLQDGSVACTDQLCIPPPCEETPKACKPGSPCKPGSTCKLDCNTCFCGDDGISLGCTKIGCLPN